MMPIMRKMNLINVHVWTSSASADFRARKTFSILVDFFMFTLQ